MADRARLTPSIVNDPATVAVVAATDDQLGPLSAGLKSADSVDGRNRPLVALRLEPVRGLLLMIT